MDIAIFSCVKSEFRGVCELKNATLNDVKQLNVHWYRRVFDKWVQRHMECIEKEGVYFEVELYMNCELSRRRTRNVVKGLGLLRIQRHDNV